MDAPWPELSAYRIIPHQGPWRSKSNPGPVQDDPLERINRLRSDIGRIDQQILTLVAWRLEVAEEIGACKRRAGLPVRNYRAEVEVLKRARAACSSLGLDPDVGQSLFQVLIEAAVGRQHGLVERPHTGTQKSVLVVGGCGRMGVWLCNYFASHGHRVTIYDVSGSSVDGFRSVTNLKAAARSADVVVLSTPIGVTAATLDTVLSADPQGLIFDICSLKSPLVESLHSAVKRGYRVASVHPLFAPDTVLLTGRILLVCDCGHAKAATEARSMFEDTALRLVNISLDRHDRYMAYVLGLSHAINIAFARTLVDSGLAAYDLDRVASTTFSKQSRTTREVAMENPLLYYEIQHYNVHTPEVLDNLRAAVEALKHAALCDGPQAFEALMEENRNYFESAVLEKDDTAE